MKNMNKNNRTNHTYKRHYIESTPARDIPCPFACTFDKECRYPNDVASSLPDDCDNYISKINSVNLNSVSPNSVSPNSVKAPFHDKKTGSKDNVNFDFYNKNAEELKEFFRELLSKVDSVDKINVKINKINKDSDSTDTNSTDTNSTDTNSTDTNFTDTNFTDNTDDTIPDTKNPAKTKFRDPNKPDIRVEHTKNGDSVEIFTPRCFDISHILFNDYDSPIWICTQRIYPDAVDRYFTQFYICANDTEEGFDEDEAKNMIMIPVTKQFLMNIMFNDLPKTTFNAYTYYERTELAINQYCERNKDNGIKVIFDTDFDCFIELDDDDWYEDD